jgi:3-hydroxyisobutyrate dehydrogenase
VSRAISGFRGPAWQDEHTLSEHKLSENTGIAFIGLGNMGAPMLRRLAEAYARIRVFDLDPDRVAQCAGTTNAEPMASASEAVSGAGLVIMMLPDARAVSDLLFQQGMAEALEPGAIVIDMGSSYPPATRETGARLAESRMVLLDAPVSGGVRRAEDATLTIMLGGDDAAAISTAEPVLASMGTVHRTGTLGSGHALKALNNYVSAAGLTAAAEALHVGQAFGLDPGTMIEVFNVSTGRNNATEVKFRQHIISGTFASGFALGLMAKDLGAAADLAKEVGVEAPNLQSEASLWREAREVLGFTADHTEIYRYLDPDGIGAAGEDVS